MAIEGVPWFPGQDGADVSAEVARLLAYGLGHGVLAPEALKVTPLPTPGAAVRLAKGPAAIEHRGVGGEYQAYVALGKTATDVAVAATGSSGGRTDLVVLRVEDPTMPGEGWQVPVDVANGPYVHARVIPNVPTGTTELAQVPGYEGQTAATLARVDIPANTATITAAMITDLRELATPHAPLVVRVMNGPTANDSLTSTAGRRWPVYAPNVKVPKWANYMSVVATIASVGQEGAAVAGTLAVALGAAGATQWRSSNTFYDVNGDGTTQRLTLTIGGAGTIPEALRGTVQAISCEGKRDAGSGVLRTLAGTHVVFDIVFEQRIL